MQDEYQFDYSKAKPNRFASRIGRDQLLIVLDPDVAAVFKTPESVNAGIAGDYHLNARIGKRDRLSCMFCFMILASRFLSQHEPHSHFLSLIYSGS